MMSQEQPRIIQRLKRRVMVLLVVCVVSLVAVLACCLYCYALPSMTRKIVRAREYDSFWKMQAMTAYLHYWSCFGESPSNGEELLRHAPILWLPKGCTDINVAEAKREDGRLVTIDYLGDNAKVRTKFTFKRASTTVNTSEEAREKLWAVDFTRVVTSAAVKYGHANWSMPTMDDLRAWLGEENPYAWTNRYTGKPMIMTSEFSPGDFDFKTNTQTSEVTAIYHLRNWGSFEWVAYVSIPKD